MIRAASILLLVFLISVGFIPESQGQSVQFNSLSLRDGLSQATVTSMIQDEQGFVWIGTRDGLNRYDGYGFKIFRKTGEDTNGLSSSAISALCQTRDGSIWVGTNFGLNKLNPKTFYAQRFYRWFEDSGSLSSNNITALAEDRQGRLWIGTDNGLNLRDKSGKFKHYTIVEDDPNSLSGNVISDILIDYRGGVWVATENGLNKYDPRKDGFIRYRHSYSDENSISDNNVLSLAEGEPGVLYVGTRNGLNKFNFELGVFSRYYADSPVKGFLSSSIIQSLLVDADGQLWVGTPNGLNELYSQNKNSVIYKYSETQGNSLPNDQIISLMIDASGMIWIGTRASGIATLVKDMPQFYNVNYSGIDGFEPEQNQIYSFAPASDTSIFVGTGKGIHIYFQGDGQSIFQMEPDTHPVNLLEVAVLDLKVVNDSLLFIATDGRGLLRYNRRSDVLQEFLVNSEDPQSVSANRINKILPDSRGNLWLATGGGGLSYYNSETNVFKTFRFNLQDKTTIRDNNIISICFGKDSSLWVGTGNAGLYRFDINEKTFKEHFSTDSRFSLPSNQIYSLFYATDGTLWIGTGGGGLVAYKSSTTKTSFYTVEDGLGSDVVHAITSDAYGNLWMSTNSGVTIFNRDTRTFRNYTEQDVLGKNTFTTGSCYRDDSGLIFFGGSNGFDYFNSFGLEANSFIPPVVITDFRLFGKYEGDSLISGFGTVIDRLVLDPSHTGFSVEFAALNFKQPEKNQYAYRLLGSFDDWRYVGNRRYASFSVLPPGKYTLEIIGSNNDGLWNEIPKTITIVISPTIWETLWFRILAGIVIAGAIILFFRYRIDSEKARSRELEMAVDQRTREIAKERDANAILLREVHHRVKNNLQIIVSLLSLQSRFIKEQKLNDVFAEIQNRVRSMSLIHQKMYKTKDLSSVNIEEYITELSNSLINTYRLSQQVELDVKIDVHRFNSDTLTPLGLIINEIISNALKYAFSEDKKGTIIVRLNKLNENTYRMIIGDDGIGISDNEVPSEESFGTELISALTEQLEGSITLLREKRGTVYQVDFKDVGM